MLSKGNLLFQMDRSKEFIVVIVLRRWQEVVNIMKLIDNIDIQVESCREVFHTLFTKQLVQ